MFYLCCLNQVGAYGGFVKERFERCLDLYLCPRAFKRRLNIDPESLVPRLPRPRELKPFPNALCVEYRGHAASVRCIACSGDGQWMATGDDNGVLIVWEVRRFSVFFWIEGGSGSGRPRGTTMGCLWCARYEFFQVYLHGRGEEQWIGDGLLL